MSCFMSHAKYLKGELELSSMGSKISTPAVRAGKVQVLAFAKFGTALRSSAGSAKSNGVLDYSKQDLSISSEAREKVHASR